MGVGYLGLADRIDHTSSSEWASRQGEAIDTEQVHHTAGTSDVGARLLMDPGGRTVSANYLLLRDGTLVEVVPGQYRAYTSASGFDRRCLTIETVNQTGSPTWGISEAQRKRLAKLAREMRAAGLGITLGKRGVGGIIGHSEVPGTYPTACPGPDMQLDHIAALSSSGSIDPDAPVALNEGTDTMLILSSAYGTGPDQPAVFNAAPGALALERNHNVINQMRAADVKLVEVSDNDLNAWLFGLTGITADEFADFDPARGPEAAKVWTLAGGTR